MTWDEIRFHMKTNLGYKEAFREIQKRDERLLERFDTMIKK